MTVTGIDQELKCSVHSDKLLLHPTSDFDNNHKGPCRHEHEFHTSTNVPSLWPRTRTYVLIFTPGWLPPPSPPKVGGLPPAKTPAGGLGGGSPPARGIWGAGDPQGAKRNIKYRPKDSYAKLRCIQLAISKTVARNCRTSATYRTVN
jgi:hypothetical protein